MSFDSKALRMLCALLGLILAGSWERPSFATVYKYKDSQGNWHFTDTPPEGQGVEETQNGKTDAHPVSWDLNRYLEEKLRPRNVLEKARNYTVTLKTPIGLGSGFFIDEKGSIVTNRHLFEGDKNQMEAANQLLKNETARLENFKKDLLAFAANLMAFERLGDEPRLTQSLKKEDLDAFSRLYKEFDRKDPAFSMNAQRFDAALQDLHQRQEKLDKLKEYLQDLERKASHPPAYVTVLLADNTSFEARFIAKSPDHDLALFRLSGYQTPCPEFADVFRIAAGARVYAIGSPMGLSHSVTEGIFSSLRRDSRGAWIIQSTAKVNKGNSGGPLIDEKGRVLGVNTAKMLRPGAEGISLSVSINTVTEAFRSELK